METSNSIYTYYSCVYQYVEPEPPPASGAEWPEERDYPGIRAEIRIATERGCIVPTMRAEHVWCGGEPLGQDWGIPGWRAGPRYRAQIFRAPTLVAAMAAAAAWTAEAEAALSAVLGARNVRLAQREATIAAATAVVPAGIQLPNG